MAAYVPIDLHRHRSVVMHMADDGEVLGWTRLANDPETLVAEVRKAGEDPQVAIEATYGWYWAVDACADAGLDCASGGAVEGGGVRRSAGEERSARLSAAGRSAASRDAPRSLDRPTRGARVAGARALSGQARRAAVRA